MTFTAIYVPVADGYVAFAEELPGANTQGATLDEARENLTEAIELVLDANRELVAKAIGNQPVVREPLVVAAP